MTLANLKPVPTPPATASAAQAQVAHSGQAATGDFAGIFDAAASSAAKDGDAPALPGMAKRNRKSATGDPSSDLDGTKSETDDGARAGGGQGSGTPASLDIAALAEMAATLAPAASQPTSAAPANAVTPTSATNTVVSSTSRPQAASATKTATPSASAAGAESSSSPLATTGSSSTTVTPLPAPVQAAMNGGGGAATAGAGASSSLPASTGPSSTTVTPSAAPVQAATNGGGGAATGVSAEAAVPATPAPAESTEDGLAKAQGATPAEAAVASAAAVGPAGAGTPGDATTLKTGAPAHPEPVKVKAQGASPTATTGSTSQVGRRPAGRDPAPLNGAGDTSSVTLQSPDSTAGLTPAATAVGTVGPEAPATPAQQVVTALQTLVQPPTAEAPKAPTAATAAAPVEATVTTAPGVKTLTIQLDPGHLGPVSVTLRMKGDAVDIQIAVSTPQALHILERDRHVLAAAVEAMGGSGTALHLGKADVSADAGASFSNPSFSQGGFSRQDGSADAPSTGRGNGNRSAAPQDTNQSDPDDATPATPAAPPRARDGSLYL